MASPRSLLRPVREVAFRSRSQVSKTKTLPFVQTRYASNEQNTPETPGIPHVSEEQAEMDKSMGNTPPDISQGTPVQEMLNRDKDAQKNAPQVIKEEMKSQNGAGQKRSYSTSTRRPAQLQQTQISEHGMIRGMEYPHLGPGHKFPLPDASSLSRLDHLRRRYDPVVDQVTKSIMRDGKLSVAQKNMSEILNTLRTAPPPQVNAQFPQRALLLSDNASPAIPQNPFGQPPQNDAQITSLPRSTLPLHPIEYLTTIIDSVAPLLKIRQQKGAMGGGGTLPIPVPLNVRQRRRQAIQWVLAAAEGRKETKLADRVAKELLSIAEGKSGAWERRAMVHRLAVSARSNIKTRGRAPRR